MNISFNQCHAVVFFVVVFHRLPCLCVLTCLGCQHQMSHDAFQIVFLFHQMILSQRKSRVSCVQNSYQGWSRNQFFSSLCVQQSYHTPSNQFLYDHNAFFSCFCRQHGFFSCVSFLFWISFLFQLSFSLLYLLIYHLLYNSFQVLESSECFQLQNLCQRPIMIRTFCISLQTKK